MFYSAADCRLEHQHTAGQSVCQQQEGEEEGENFPQTPSENHTVLYHVEYREPLYTFLKCYLPVCPFVPEM